MLDAAPGWAKWLLAYVAALAVSSLVGFVTPLGAGNAIFIAGALAVFASLTFIRLGCPKAMVGRDLKGKPIFDYDAKKRGSEIRRGLGIFLLGLALWAVLVASLLWA